MDAGAPKVWMTRLVVTAKNLYSSGSRSITTKLAKWVYSLSSENQRKGPIRPAKSVITAWMLALPSVLPTEQEAAFAAFSDLGVDFLKPVFEKLAGQIDYDELKVLRLIFMASQD